MTAYGVREDDSKVFLHVGPGHGETYENWKTFLQEITRRGLKTPLLTVTDGNPGAMRAVEEVFPVGLRQRCQKHKMQNIPCKVPRQATPMLRKEICKAFHAKSYEEGLRIGRFPSAMKCMAQDLEACLQCLRLPAEHHKRVRTTNLLERPLGENRRRVKVIPHFFAERAGMKLVYATMLAASCRWHGVQMNPLINRAIDQLGLDLRILGEGPDSISWTANSGKVAMWRSSGSQ